MSFRGQYSAGKGKMNCYFSGCLEVLADSSCLLPAEIKQCRNEEDDEKRFLEG